MGSVVRERVRAASFAGAVALLLLAGLAAPPSAGAQQAPGDPGVVPGSYIVTLHPEHPAAVTAPALARAHGGEVGHIYEHALNGFSFRGSAQAAAALERNPNVRTVVEDRLVHAAEEVPTGVSRVDARHVDGHPGGEGRGEAHEIGGGEGVSVAILDTGIQTNHPDLAANVDTTHAETCITSTYEDANGHGTHVAGTVAAVDNDIGVVGVAHEARLVPVKVLDDSGSGSWASVICGVDHVTGLVGVAGGPIVANMSLGGSGAAEGCDDGGLHEAVCASVDAGVTYTVAAGNASTNVAGSVPAAFPEVITVSALADFDGAPGGDGGCRTFRGGGPPRTQCDDEFAFFSNYGAGVDVIAPGVSIRSTDAGSTYSTKSGTSMAAPHAAGVAALVLAEASAMAPDDVMGLLQETGECPDGSQNGSGSPCSGASWPGDPDGIAEPLVNAYWALLAVADYEPPATGTLTGTVTDADGGASTEGATVAVEGTELEATTDADGDYVLLNVPVGEHTATASADGFEPATAEVTIEEDERTTWDVALTGVPEPEPGSLSGTVTDADGGASIEGATVAVEGTGLQATTDADGAYTIAGIEPGEHTATASAEGYEAASATFAVTDGDDVTRDFALESEPEPDEPGSLALSVSTYKVRGVNHADLAWNGDSGTSYTVLFNGDDVATVTDTSYTHNTGQRGGRSATYQVCEAETSTCSAEVAVAW